MNNRLLFIGAPENNQAPIDHLKKQGYEVHLTHGLRPSLRALSEYTFAAVIIDLGDVTAINSKRISHKAGRRPERPFIILISGHRSQRFDDLVYDDTLIRPFTSRALEQTLRKHLDQRRNAVVQLGPITLDRRTHVVKTPHGLARLTYKQFQLLDYFVENVGKLVTRRDLMLAVWDTDYLGDTRTLDVHIRWLREQIEKDPSNPRYLVTERGHGYRLNLSDEPQEGGEPLIYDQKRGSKK